GLARAQVWVLDAAGAASSAGLLPAPLAILDLFADKPRALAVTPDGATVYAAGFMTGNRTTVLNTAVVCASNNPCPTVTGTVRGLPSPIENHAGTNGPATGLIVKLDPGSSRWLDELGRNWGPAMRFTLPDLDVFKIDAAAATPSVTAQLAGV